MRNLTVLATLPAVAFAAWASIADEREKSDRPPQRPLVAVWQQVAREGKGPCLRVAIWEDGRVLFAEDPKRWDSPLRQGKIAPRRVEQLKQAIADSGVFELKGTCYLVPDAPVDCLMVDFGKRKQMLYWDEVETPHYGINGSGKPQHTAFKQCWKIVNHLALVTCPDDSRPAAAFNVPQHWQLWPAIQSE